MSEGKKQYEISFLARNEGDKDEVMKALAAINAEILVDGKYSEIRLAYPVKKQTVAYFGFVDFSVEAEKIAELDNKLRFYEGILRFLIITPPPRKPIPRAERRSDDAAPAEQATAASAPIAAEESVKEEEVSVEPEVKAEEVNDELLDQKLDEILK